MEPSSEQHNHQEMGSQTLESMLACTKVGQAQVGKKPRPADMQALKCPRCESSNTKFCYYNNYSLSQPRYFCKSCRRYWTKGGTLRNVPVGGGCRKNTKRSSTKRLTQLNPHHLMLTTSSPSLTSYDPTGDLSLAIARLHQQNPGLGPLDEPDSLSSIWGGNHLGPGHLGPPFESGLMGDSSSGRDNNNKYCGGMAQEMGLPFGNFGGGMKPDNRGMMWGGFSWQGAGVDGNGADLNAGRDFGWSGLGLSTWHGLLNSPLM